MPTNGDWKRLDGLAQRVHENCVEKGGELRNWMPSIARGDTLQLVSDSGGNSFEPRPARSERGIQIRKGTARRMVRIFPRWLASHPGCRGGMGPPVLQRDSRARGCRRRCHEDLR